MWRLLLLLNVMVFVVSGCAASNQSGFINRVFGEPASTVAASDDIVVSSTAPSVGGTPAFSGSPEKKGATPPASVTTPSASYVPPNTSSDYKLGPGDRIMVTVFNEKDLMVDTRLSDAGTLSFPLLGEIRAQGMTTGMLQDVLTEQLRNGFLVNPQVYVSILEYRQFFVNGEVNKPGGLPYQPGLTARKAIALAGGFTPRASQTKIFIIRDDDPYGRPRSATLDTVLRPGDILTIEQSFF
jgi:polysaccharide export outer membrane protein